MATFPSIVPSSRLLITGDFPNVLQSSLSGVSTGYRRGNRRVEQVLQLLLFPGAPRLPRVPLEPFGPFKVLLYLLYVYINP